MSHLRLTKLYRPAIPPRRVQRDRLLKQLHDGLIFGRQITLVSAPAGFGKTVCISEWIDTLDLPVAWLSLDDADDEPGQFFTYFVAALQRINKNLGWEVAGVLRSGQLPPAEIISTTLVNDILEYDEHFVLVLDDLHLIQHDFILEVLETLTANLPPALHLVILTREDPVLPLARLRASNLMTEIRVGDLRFTSNEVRQFLNDVMNLPLSLNDIDALEDKTEGWIVGLQLAALAMQAFPAGQGSATISKFIETLSGSHRHILSYLTEEVLNQQPAEIQQFLLQTSILDRMTGDLCNAVTGRTNSHQLLEQLYNDNLFLIPLDNEQRWYRYHHLFADLLRDLQTEVHKNEVFELHQRASHWYEQIGDAKEAIDHAFIAGDYATAVRLIEKHVMEMLMQWHVKTVDGWMQALPPAWVMQSPRTNLAFAWKHLLYGEHVQAMPYIERLQTMFLHEGSGEQDVHLKAEWLALQSTLLNAQGQAQEGLALAQQSLEIVQDRNDYVKSLIYLGVVSAYQQMEDYDQAVESYQRIIQHGRAANNLVIEMHGASGLGLLALQHGDLHFAHEIVAEAVERIERSGSLPPISTALYGELGSIYYQWNQLEQAHSYFLKSVQVSALSGFSDAEIYHSVILSRLHQIRGNLDAAASEIEKATSLMQEVAPAAVREEADAQQVRIYLAQDRLADAEQVIRPYGFSFQGKLVIPEFIHDHTVTRYVNPMHTSALRILLYRATVKSEQSSLEIGINLADKLLANLFEYRYVSPMLEILLLRAQMYMQLVDEQSSMASYLYALELAEPEGFISVFVEGGEPVDRALTILLQQNQLGDLQPDYVRRILSAFSRSQPDEKPHRQVTQPGEQTVVIDPLTERELDVLQLMADGLTYQEIADNLIISLNTVRFYVKAIYSKLGVNKRVKAVALASQLNLI